MMTRLVIPAAAMTLLLAVANAAPARAATVEQQYDGKAVTATNHARKSYGLRPVKANACLRRYATQQAARMAAQQGIFHQDLGTVLRACRLRLVGENVASGFRTGTSVVRDGWMHSPPHRANILDRRFRLIAVGAREGADGRWYTSQLFARR